MADPLSISASVAGLIGLTGQLLSGCLYLKDFYDNAKDAPEEILSLATQLDALSGVVQDTSNRLIGLPQGPIIVHFETTIKQCLDIVDSMKSELNGYSAKLGGTKKSRWWTKLQYASKKKAFSSQLSRLEHAKTQLLMMNDNIFDIKQNKIYESLTTGNHMLQTVSISSARTELVIDQTHMELRDISRTMDRSNSETTVISSDVKQLRQDLDRLTQALDPQVFIPQLASLVQRGGFRSLGEHRDSITLSQSFDQSTPYTNSPSISNAFACGRKRARKRRISRTIRKVAFLDIEVVTFELLGTTNDIQGGHCIAPAITAETHIQLKFPLSQRTISLHTLQEALNPHVTRTLTTYNTLSESSPLFQAVESLDLCEMRRLFANGLASPRDRFKVAEYTGYSSEPTILDHILCKILDSYEPEAISTSQKVLDMLEYLLQIAPPRSEHSEWVEFLFAPWSRVGNGGDNHVAKLRLLDQYCPIQFWENIEPQFCLDALYDDNPIHTFIRARDGSIFDLKSQFLEDYEGKTHFAENTRHMLEDTNGSGLLLALRQNYAYWPLIGSIKCLRSEHLITRLLGLCTESCQSDLIQSCQARITILINHGYYTNYLRNTNRIEWVIYLPLALHPMEFAILSNTFHILHNALLNAGWSERTIQASLDEVMYAGIPELFEGIQYMSQDECRQEFIQGLCKGHYLNFMNDPNWHLASGKLALSLGIENVTISEDMIKEANASYSRRSSPGSWPMEPDQQLIPGIDFNLPEYFPVAKRYPLESASVADWPCVQAILHQHRLSDDTFVQ